MVIESRIQCPIYIVIITNKEIGSPYQYNTNIKYHLRRLATAIFIMAILGSFVSSRHIMHFPSLQGSQNLLEIALLQLIWAHVIQDVLEVHSDAYHPCFIDISHTMAHSSSLIFWFSPCGPLAFASRRSTIRIIPHIFVTIFVMASVRMKFRVE